MAKALLRALPLDAALKRLAARAVLQDMRPGRPTLLVMNRAVLSSDLAALVQRTELNVIETRAAEYEAAMARLLPAREREQTYFQRSYDQAPESFRAPLRAAATKALEAYRKRAPFDAIVVGNTDYWQDVPLMDAARAAGIPFLVLCRENYAVEETQVWLENRIDDSGYLFKGDGVAVASDITRDFFRRTGSYPEGTVETVGWPRFDSWLDPNPYPPDARDMITLISYHEPLYLGPENYADVLRCFVDAARASGAPKRFAIKLKKMAHLKFVLSICPGLLTSGVKIVARQPLDDLLRRSRMVIGYNTTGVLEGYLTDAAIVVPWWKDAVRSADDTLIAHETQEDRATTHFPDSPAALRELIDRAVVGPLPVLGTPEQRRGRFQRFVAFDPEESASSKFEAFVRRYVKPASPS